jgi:hypothetical protein
MSDRNLLGNSQRRENTKRLGLNGEPRPAQREPKGHPKREARRQRAYDRGAPRPQESKS